MIQGAALSLRNHFRSLAKRVSGHACHAARRLTGDALLVCLAASGVLAAAHAGSGPVRAWYYQGGGYGRVADGYFQEGQYGARVDVAVPKDLGNCSKVSVGGGHFGALTIGGEVRAWGRNDVGQATVPPDIGLCTDIALGGAHTLALNKFGGIRAFGENTSGQCSVPFGLGAYRAIAAGDRHSIAIRSNGQVVAWGSNSDGQRNVPADLGPCVQVAAGAVHSVALKANGVVRAWGANGASCINCDLGQTGIDGQSGASAIAAGGRSSIAILGGSKTIVGFGKLALGCEPVFFDATQLGFRSLAVGSRAFGVTLDGRASGAGAVAEFWGYYCSVGSGNSGDDFSQRALPPEVARWVQVATGSGGHAAGIVESDCNDDGIEDALQLEGSDCDANGRLDACDAVAGIVEDCNANGIGDECEKQLTVDLASGRRGPFGSPNSIVWEIPAAPTALDWVSINGQVRGDLSSPAEFITVRVGSTVVGTLSWPNAQDCTIQQFFAVGNGIPAEVFNAAIRPDGSVQISFSPSVAVNPALCPTGTWIEASLSYTAAAPSDCNANGILDACEIAGGSTPDANGNGRPDSCDAGFGSCTGDLVADGIVNGADLGELLAAWGPASANASADINRDGFVNGADLGELLVNWGPCGS
jgi:hypothetical protein